MIRRKTDTFPPSRPSPTLKKSGSYRLTQSKKYKLKVFFDFQPRLSLPPLEFCVSQLQWDCRLAQTLPAFFILDIGCCFATCAAVWRNYMGADEDRTEETGYIRDGYEMGPSHPKRRDLKTSLKKKLRIWDVFRRFCSCDSITFLMKTVQFKIYTWMFLKNLMEKYWISKLN